MLKFIAILAFSVMSISPASHTLQAAPTDCCGKSCCNSTCTGPTCTACCADCSSCCKSASSCCN